MIPLLSLRLGAVLAHEAVTPTEVAKGMVGVRGAAEVAVDGDVFHVCIVVHWANNAKGKGEKVGRVNPCVPST